MNVVITGAYIKIYAALEVFINSEIKAAEQIAYQARFSFLKKEKFCLKVDKKGGIIIYNWRKVIAIRLLRCKSRNGKTVSTAYLVRHALISALYLNFKLAKGKQCTFVGKLQKRKATWLLISQSK